MMTDEWRGVWVQRGGTGELSVSRIATEQYTEVGELVRSKFVLE